MIAIRGAGSKIVQELYQIVEDQFVGVDRNKDIPTDAERYLFCAGLLRSISRDAQTDAELEEGYRVNLWRITDDCDRIFSANETARICVIGSESAYTGSFDGVYADAKRSLHRYVEQKRLGPGQQLVCISPGVIEDCGQATRRTDTWRLNERKARHPQNRFLKAIEVARLVRFCLYEDQGYLSNVVIRLNGGEHVNQESSCQTLKLVR